MCKTKALELNHILDMSLEKRDLDLVLHDPPKGGGWWFSMTHKVLPPVLGISHKS